MATMHDLQGHFLQILVGKYDLTEYVISGTVQRNVTNPIGKWSINLRPIIKNGTVCDVPIEINDYCEIRAGRKKDANGNIPLIMRGMVDAVAMAEQANQSDDGSISRQVVIGGSDMGKIFARRQIVVPADMYTDQAVQSQTAMTQIVETIYKKWRQNSTRGADETGTPPDSDIMEMSMTRWIQSFIYMVYNEEYVPSSSRNNSGSTYYIGSEINIPKRKGEDRLKVSATPLINPQGKGGSLWDYIGYFCKKPFFEMYIDDEETNSKVVVTWTPYQNFQGLWPVQKSTQEPWFPTPSIMDIDQNTIIAQDFRRNDFDRYTYFFTQPDEFWSSSKVFWVDTPVVKDAIGPPPDPKAVAEKASGILKASGAAGSGASGMSVNPYYDDPGIQKFGFKPIVAKMPFFNRLKPGEEGEDEIISLLRDANTWLVDVFSFTDRLYNGQMTFIGNPAIKIGNWIRVAGKRFYVEAVEHSWNTYPNPSYVTRVTFTRGEGFDAGSSPRQVADESLFKAAPEGFNKNMNIYGNPLMRQVAPPAVPPPPAPPEAPPPDPRHAETAHVPTPEEVAAAVAAAGAAAPAATDAAAAADASGPSPEITYVPLDQL